MAGKRFKEIISTQKVIDTQTDKEYDCLLDNDLFELINKIAEENEQLKSENMMVTGANKILKENNKRLKEEIKDFQDLLAGKEEELLKPIIRMIDDRIAHYKHKPISAPISNPVNPKYDADVDRLARLSELQQLKKELKGDDGE